MHLVRPHVLVFVAGALTASCSSEQTASGGATSAEPTELPVGQATPSPEAPPERMGGVASGPPNVTPQPAEMGVELPLPAEQPTPTEVPVAPTVPIPATLGVPVAPAEMPAPLPEVPAVPPAVVPTELPAEPPVAVPAEPPVAVPAELPVAVPPEVPVVPPAVPVPAPQPEPTRPNIIFIYADDMGYGDVSALNADSKIQTPALDAMAAGGMVFTDGHSPSSVCTPSRYGVMTGRYPWRSQRKAGVTFGFDQAELQMNRNMLPEVLKTAGYDTAMFGKWHLGMNFVASGGGRVSGGSVALNAVDWNAPITGGPVDHGFDTFFGISASGNHLPLAFLEGRGFREIPDRTFSRNELTGNHNAGPGKRGFTTEAMMPAFFDETTKYVEARQEGDAPFYIYLSLNSPHHPHAPSRAFQGMSGIGAYGDFVLEIDHLVGELMKTLEDKGILDNTLVVFSSDNGPESDMYEIRSRVQHDASGPLLGAKRDNWEGGHRVPFLAHWPAQIAAGSMHDEAVNQVDLFATFAELAGAEYDDATAPDSFSFAEALRGRPIPGATDRVMIHHAGILGVLAVRKGPWKLLCHAGSGGRGFNETGPEKEASENTTAFSLYNLEDDLYEVNNLWQDRPDIVDELRTAGAAAVQNGRTNAGPTLQNDGPAIWDQVRWINQWPPR